MKSKKLVVGSILNVLAVAIGLIFTLPLIVVTLNAFKTKAESNTMTLKLPKEWMFDNFQVVLERGKLLISFVNSVSYAALGAGLIVLLVTATAFVLSRNRTKLHKFIYYFILIGIAMPINNVTLMKIMKMTHLVNTQIGVILIYAAVNIPISLFIAYGFIGTIPVEIDEAAIIDGCNVRSLFFRIILPLLAPVMVTIFILSFMAIWNDFTMPLYYLNSSEKWPMTLAVYNFFGIFENQWNLVCADITLTILPVLIIFIAAQKFIVGGVSAGAVKG